MTVQDDEAVEKGHQNGEEEAEDISQHPIAEGDTDDAEDSPPQDGSDDSDPVEGFQVPLPTLLEERRRRQEYQRQLDELKAETEAKLARLEQWESSRDDIAQTYREREEARLAQQKLESELAAYRQLAEENNLEPDLSANEQQMLLQQLAQQVQTMPNTFRQQMDAWQREQERRSQEESRRQQAAEAARRAAEKFDKEFDELTKTYPALQTQKEVFQELHRASNGAQSAKDLLSPILGSMTGVQKAREAKAKIPKTQTGSSKETPSGSTGLFKPGETISEFFARRRKERSGR